ncbi:MAG: trypsin-like serine peptidase [Oceanicaulis sp.]
MTGLRGGRPDSVALTAPRFALHLKWTGWETAMMRAFAMIPVLAVALALCAGGAAQAQIVLPAGFSAKPGADDYARLLQAIKKPGDYEGDDSCRHANDGECDEPGLGTGACRSGTDRSDCWRILTGREDDSCQWARDGECDEPGFGTGACTQGTDQTDCGDVTELRFRSDMCATAFDGVCDEPELGTGRCAARTDRSDCVGRARPLTINDHFFGRDDRVLMDTAAFPWRVIGQASFDNGGTCTASLVAPDVLITAAHCISEDGRIDAAGEFQTGADLPGGPRRARIIDFLLSPDWDEQAFSEGDDNDGADWALLRLDLRLGDELGHLGVFAIEATGADPAGLSLRQAGYSWDTGEQLSGNLECRILEVFDDNTLAHDCDTTRGDSGSPFLVETEAGPAVIATDSNFRSNPDGPFVYIAARADAWIDALPAFVAGRTGAGGVRPRGPGKPEPLTPIKGG